MRFKKSEHCSELYKHCKSFPNTICNWKFFDVLVNFQIIEQIWLNIRSLQIYVQKELKNYEKLYLLRARWTDPSLANFLVIYFFNLFFRLGHFWGLWRLWGTFLPFPPVKVWWEWNYSIQLAVWNSTNKPSVNSLGRNNAMTFPAKLRWSDTSKLLTYLYNTVRIIIEEFRSQGIIPQNMNEFGLHKFYKNFYNILPKNSTSFLVRKWLQHFLIYAKMI